MEIYLEEASKIFISTDDTLYGLLSDTNECIFTIEGEFDDEGKVTAYTAYNGMGAGSWRRDTLQECISAIEGAYNDTVVDRTDAKVLNTEDTDKENSLPSLLKKEDTGNSPSHSNILK